MIFCRISWILPMPRMPRRKPPALIVTSGQVLTNSSIAARSGGGCKLNHAPSRRPASICRGSTPGDLDDIHPKTVSVHVKENPVAAHTPTPGGPLRPEPGDIAAEGVLSQLFQGGQQPPTILSGRSLEELLRPPCDCDVPSHGEVDLDQPTGPSVFGSGRGGSLPVRLGKPLRRGSGRKSMCARPRAPARNGSGARPFGRVPTP